MDDTTTIGLRRTDYTNVLAEACLAFVAAADAAENALKSWPGRPNSNQAGLDRSLVALVVQANAAARLILPQPSASEYFGLPRSATARIADPDPTVRVEDPGRESWDFRPWLSEKLTLLREHMMALLDTVEYVQKEPGLLNVRTSADADRAAGVQDQALYSLRASRTYAQNILNAMETLGLTVVDWRVTGQSER